MYDVIKQLNYQSCLLHFDNLAVKYSWHFSLSSVMILQPGQVVLSTNLFFRLDVSLPIVTGELLQKTVEVTNVTHKLYNIKIKTLPVSLNTKN